MVQLNEELPPKAAFLEFWKTLDWALPFADDGEPFYFDHEDSQEVGPTIISMIVEFMNEYPDVDGDWYGVDINDLMAATRQAYFYPVSPASKLSVLRNATRYLDDEGHWFDDEQLDTMEDSYFDFLVEHIYFLEPHTREKILGYIFEPKTPTEDDPDADELFIPYRVEVLKIMSEEMTPWDFGYEIDDFLLNEREEAPDTADELVGNFFSAYQEMFETVTDSEDASEGDSVPLSLEDFVLLGFYFTMTEFARAGHTFSANQSVIYQHLFDEIDYSDHHLGLILGILEDEYHYNPHRPFISDGVGLYLDEYATPTAYINTLDLT